MEIPETAVIVSQSRERKIYLANPQVGFDDSFYSILCRLCGEQARPSGVKARRYPGGPSRIALCWMGPPLPSDYVSMRTISFRFRLLMPNELNSFPDWMFCLTVCLRWFLLFNSRIIRRQEMLGNGWFVVGDFLYRNFLHFHYCYKFVALIFCIKM